MLTPHVVEVGRSGHGYLHVDERFTRGFQAQLHAVVSIAPEIIGETEIERISRDPAAIRTLGEKAAEHTAHLHSPDIPSAA
jgi:hypothetical protein